MTRRALTPRSAAARRRPRVARMAAVAFVTATALSGCGDPAPSAPVASPTGTVAIGTVTVFAASSLTETFNELGRRFEKQHPNTNVELTFGPSNGLASQIVRDPQADVFAGAGHSTMEFVVAARKASNPAPFATNTMQLAVPASNPGNITGLSDLGRSGLRVGVCQSAVPCGRAAGAVIRKAGLTFAPSTLESDAKALITRVRFGEVDAAIAYRTDVRAAGSAVRGITIPDDVNETTTYHIAQVDNASNPVTAKAFVDYVTSDEARELLGEAGFGTP